MPTPGTLRKTSTLGSDQIKELNTSADQRLMLLLLIGFWHSLDDNVLVAPSGFANDQCVFGLLDTLHELLHSVNAVLDRSSQPAFGVANIKFL